MLRHEILSMLAMLVVLAAGTTQASGVPESNAQTGQEQQQQQLIKSQADLLAECERLDQQQQQQQTSSDIQEICVRARLAAQALLLGESNLARVLVEELTTGAGNAHYGHRDTRSLLSRGVHGMSRGQSEAFNRLLLGGGGLDATNPFEAGAEFSLAADGGGSGDKPLWASAMGGETVNMMGSRWQPMRGKRDGARRLPVYATGRHGRFATTTGW